MIHLLFNNADKNYLDIIDGLGGSDVLRLVDINTTVIVSPTTVRW